MIRDGVVTYAARDTSIIEWAPSSDTARFLLIAVATTIISYQLTALLLDLAFGLKPYGIAPERDLLMLTLVRRASPFAAVRALFESPGATGSSSDGFSAVDLETARDPVGNRLKAGVVVKLCILLLLAPVINIASIALSLEYERSLTFSEAEFGGLAMGIDFSETPVEWKGVPISEGCFEADVNAAQGDRLVATFMLCQRREVGHDRLNDGKAGVHLLVNGGHVANLFFTTPAGNLNVNTVGYMSVNEGIRGLQEATWYHVAHTMTNASALVLVKDALDHIQEWCQNGTITDLDIETEPSATFLGFDIDIFKRVPCDRIPTAADVAWLRDLVTKTASRITWVDSQNLRIVKISESSFLRTEFDTSDDVSLLRRRRTVASVLVLIIIAGALIVTRVTVRAFTRNDLTIAVGLFVREYLGLPCCDTMLTRNSVTTFYGSNVTRKLSDTSDEP